MNIIYSGQRKDIIGKSIFLAGPSPREEQSVTWRHVAERYFKSLDFNGTLIFPESEFGIWESYDNVMDWEDEYLNRCDLIMFWVCRDLDEKIYGLTTNVEFGRFLNSGKIIYGRPDHSDSNRYLDYWYERTYEMKPHNRLHNLCLDSIIRLEKEI